VPPPLPASGYIVNLEIQERRDRERAARPTQLEARSRSLFDEARVWAQRVGFSIEEEPLAAMAAVMLRGLRGVGCVTRGDVLARVRHSYADLFPVAERAA